LESDALVDNLNVLIYKWTFDVRMQSFTFFSEKNTAICKYMYEGPAVALKPQGPEGP